jgi:sterol desaturase/sphingolipid hydroxylase (fatty acid hydroxylase superfamily)
MHLSPDVILRLQHFGVDVARLGIWLVILAAIFVPLEKLFAVHRAPIWRKEFGTDLWWYFINSLVPAVIMAVPLAFLIRFVQGRNPFGLYSMVAAWPLWTKLPLALLVNDLGAYWAHRAAHAVPFLWRFHAVHHSAKHVDWLVNTRDHPFDVVFIHLAGLAPVYLLGLGHVTRSGMDPAVLDVVLIGTVWSFFIHANIRVRLGPLEWLLATPAFHHWHHTNDEHRNRNFASMFPVLDFIFRTGWLPKSWPTAYGIDEEMPPTVTEQLVHPLIKRQSR